MQEVQEGNGESDLAAIRAWREKRTDGRMIKDHRTAPQYVMYEDLKRRLKIKSPIGHTRGRTTYHRTQHKVCLGAHCA